MKPIIPEVFQKYLMIIKVSDIRSHHIGQLCLKTFQLFHM